LNEGKKFETNFKKSVPNNMYYFRVKDPAIAFNQSDNQSNIRFSPKNPYDSFLFYISNLFPLELKSTSSTSISIQKSKDEKSKMIKIHQIRGLQDANNFEGILAGFVFDFRTSDNTYYMSISNFMKFLNNVNKKSINEKDILEYGGFIIEKKIKKVNYTYDIKNMIENIISRKGEKESNNEIWRF